MEAKTFTNKNPVLNSERDLILRADRFAERRKTAVLQEEEICQRCTRKS